MLMRLSMSATVSTISIPLLWAWPWRNSFTCNPNVGMHVQRLVISHPRLLVLYCFFSIKILDFRSGREFINLDKHLRSERHCKDFCQSTSDFLFLNCNQSCPKRAERSATYCNASLYSEPASFCNWYHSIKEMRWSHETNFFNRVERAIKNKPMYQLMFKHNVWWWCLRYDVCKSEVFLVSAYE